MPPSWSNLLTEQPNPASANLDTLSTRELVKLMNDEDRTVPEAVTAVLGDIERTVDMVAERLRDGGRLFYVGAGTSGRLGVLDASECPPTFSTEPGMVQGIIAGGNEAVFQSKENAEDEPEAAASELALRAVSRHDVVVGIAASGVTPFVLGALKAGGEVGAGTVFLTCSPEAAGRVEADVKIVAAVGPEVLTGSTRLKAGTATKLILNMISTCSMVRLGKVYGNRMVDVRPWSAKLRDRALRILKDIANIDDDTASAILKNSGNDLKTALVMARRNVTKERAQELLTETDGNVRQAFGDGEADG